MEELRKRLEELTEEAKKLDAVLDMDRLIEVYDEQSKVINEIMKVRNEDADI